MPETFSLRPTSPAAGCDARLEAFDALIVPEGSGEPFAGVIESNPLAGESPAIPAFAPGGRLVVRSGWIGGDANPTDGIYRPGIETWTGLGWSRWTEWCAAAAPILRQRGLTALLRPHARHVVSDPQSARTWLRAHEDGPFGLLLDPVAMLTPDMLAAAEDHIGRAVEGLADHPAVAAIVVAGAELVETESGPELRACPAGAGELDPEILESAIARSGAGELPRILIPPANAPFARDPSRAATVAPTSMTQHGES